MNFASPVTGSDKIIVRENDAIEIYCPGSSILINNQSLRTNLTRIKCVKGKFTLSDEGINFQSLTCLKKPRHIAQYTNKKCLKKFDEFEIGYRYKNKFLRLIRGCFDKAEQITLYTVHTVSKAIVHRQRSHARSTYWAVGSFYTIGHVDDAYKRNNQRIAINNQLGLEASSTKYISNTSDNYHLIRGHLAPKADFLYGPQQDATFYFLNAIPQWHLLNNGNWKRLEDGIRHLAVRKQKDLKVYTGTSGVMVLPNESKNKSWTNLYLYLDGNKRSLPIPKYVWKVVYDEDSKAGVAFVGVNDPFLMGNLNEYRICENYRFKLNEIDLDPDYLKSGYVYHCKIEDLRKSNFTLPPFHVNHLLV